LAETSIADWRRIIDVNLTGAFLCCQAAAKRMALRGGGRIINFGSIVGNLSIAGNAAYGASMAGLKLLTAVLNQEFNQYNVRATFLTLGAVATNLWSQAPEFDRTKMLSADDAARTITHILTQPLHVRLDEVTLLPPAGIL
jgi:NAD(P)-dependent dehydrogenase (short-subunit alcohol dehydrogenase family)